MNDALTRRERRDAERFIRKHGIGSLPGARLPNGESAEPQRSDWLGGADRQGGTETSGGGSRGRIVSYDQFGTLAQWEDWMLDHDRDYVPLVGRGASAPTLEQLEKRARMAHVMSYLPARSRDLLYAIHVEGRTEADLGRQHGVTQQAISKRLKVAEQDFKAAFGEHWNDDIDLDLSVE